MQKEVQKAYEMGFQTRSKKTPRRSSILEGRMIQEIDDEMPVMKKCMYGHTQTTTRKYCPMRVQHKVCGQILEPVKG